MVKLEGRKGEKSRFGDIAEIANDDDSRLFASRFVASSSCCIGVSGGIGGILICC